MQSHNNSSENATMRRTVLIFGVCICVILGISQISPIKAAISNIMDILTPVLIGVLMAYIINPLEIRLEKLFLKCFSGIKREQKRKNLSRVFSVATSLVTLLLVIALLIFLIVPEFLQSLAELIKMAPALFAKVMEWFSSHGQSDLVVILSENFDTVVASVSGLLSGEVSNALSGILTGVANVFSFLVNFFISIVICVYALIEKEKFIGNVKKLTFALFKPSRANDILEVARYSNDMFGKFLSGKIIVSAIVGVVTFLFMTVAGIPYSLLSAGVVAITNVIPYFGPFLGGIPTAAIILLTDFRKGIIYIIFLVVLQQIEGNVIEPLIMEDKTGVSKFWITVALIVCGGTFGVVGMLFSVPIFAVIFYVINMSVERKLRQKNLPVNGEEYYNVGSYDEETSTLVPAPEKQPRKKISSVIKSWFARLSNKEE